jgi:hypothetical protein
LGGLDQSPSGGLRIYNCLIKNLTCKTLREKPGQERSNAVLQIRLTKSIFKNAILSIVKTLPRLKRIVSYHWDRGIWRPRLELPSAYWLPSLYMWEIMKNILLVCSIQFNQQFLRCQGTIVAFLQVRVTRRESNSTQSKGQPFIFAFNSQHNSNKLCMKCIRNSKISSKTT